jgi:hypothetical protein
MNSDTPRTDNAACDGTTVPADFAADLECEIAELQAEVERLRAVAGQALEALNSDHPDIQLRAATALRAALKETK